MSDTQTGTALTPAQQFNQQLDAQVQNFRALLPSHIPVEKFKRVVVVAISQNPDLFKADRRSLFTAAQKCASDGLLPDGRQAALVVYGGQAVYMPMVAGVRQRMRNSGEVLSAEAYVVYSNDEFHQEFGDNPTITHKPTPLGVERGEPVGAYAIIRLKNGEILREIMDKHEIERVRVASKSANGPAWKNWWGEMARKSVLRRCAKAAPTSADIDDLLARDDEVPANAPMVDITPPEPEPPRGNAITHQPQESQPFLVVDCDGEEHEYATTNEAFGALEVICEDAARRGSSHLEAALENNAALIAELHFEIGIGESQPNSPAGIKPPDTERSHAKSASDAAPKPAGDTDLLGAKRKPKRDLHIPMKNVPSENELESWKNKIDRFLDDGEHPVNIREANSAFLENLSRIDPLEYETAMQKLRDR